MELYVLAGIEMLVVLFVGWRFARVKPWKDRCARLQQSERYFYDRLVKEVDLRDRLNVEVCRLRAKLDSFGSHCQFCGQFLTTGSICDECADGEERAKFGDDGPWDDSTMDELN